MTPVELLSVAAIDEPADAFVRRHSRVLAAFDRTQDSGNVSWLVDADGRRLFVKTAGRAGSSPSGPSAPYFDHADRVVLLRNAVALARSCKHPALAPLLNVIESPDGPMLVYAAAPGENVHVPRERRGDPASAYQRFAHLPAERLLGVFDTLIDLHRALAAGLARSVVRRVAAPSVDGSGGSPSVRGRMVARSGQLGGPSDERGCSGRRPSWLRRSSSSAHRSTSAPPSSPWPGSSGTSALG